MKTSLRLPHEFMLPLGKDNNHSFDIYLNGKGNKFSLTMTLLTFLNFFISKISQKS
jgi:hypothetical protein